VNPDGEVNDVERVRYLHTHLEAAARAIQDGAGQLGLRAARRGVRSLSV
jgi:beta-glucosidase/6-phospho-beta-glucosidase/beta-galactosidase